ncbi:MAG: hypothetical protein AMS27_01245 [Bacteroides sp. SM23_62_1]|nr:MAG: hypothetical protein AMS27_01245 [Bacteroides sp. SM23_62_1]
MKRIISILFTAILAIPSCTDHFEDLNSDPNNLVDVPAINLFTSVIINTCGREGTGAYYCERGWAQHWSYCCYKSDDRYLPRTFDLNVELVYSQELLDLELIIRKTRADISREKEMEKNTSLLAAAKIMRVFNFHRLTDLVGDIPYLEALQGLDDDGVTTPKYDTQESIYMDLLDELEEANELLDLSVVSNFGKGDLLFGGDPARWKKFGNSLRLRILNRCAGTPWFFAYDMVGTIPLTTTPGAAAYPGADAEIDAILDNPARYPIISGNEDNVLLVYPGDEYKQPIYQAFYSRTPFNMAETLINWLVDRNDPRIHIFACPTWDYVNGITTDAYVGEQNGSPYLSSYDPEVSAIGYRICKDESAPLYIMTHDEIEFIKAEHYLRTGSEMAAREAYEAGITASMERWGCSDGSIVFPLGFYRGEIYTYTITQHVDFASYLAEPMVNWVVAGSEGEKYQRILEQKWAASFTQGFQVWTEVRRTGFPARIFEYEYSATYFPDLGMPVRMNIMEVSQINSANLEEAKKRQNIEQTNYGLFSTDGIKSQMWWHTRKNPVPTETDPPEIW